MATICVQTGLNPALHILESLCQGLWPPRSSNLMPPDYFLRENKLSLSDVPIRNNQAASDRTSEVAKVPGKDFPK